MMKKEMRVMDCPLLLKIGSALNNDLAFGILLKTNGYANFVKNAEN